MVYGDLVNFNQVIKKSKEISKILKMMANNERIIILCNLIEGEKSVESLRFNSSLSQSAFSQHLKVLRDSNIISSRRESLRVFYSLSDKRVIDIINSLKI